MSLYTATTPPSSSGAEYEHWLWDAGPSVGVLQLSKPCPFGVKWNLSRTKKAWKRSCYSVFCSILFLAVQLIRHNYNIYFIIALKLYQLFPRLNSECAFWQYFLRQGNSTSCEVLYLFHYWWQHFDHDVVEVNMCVYCVNLFFLSLCLILWALINILFLIKPCTPNLNINKFHSWINYLHEELQSQIFSVLSFYDIYWLEHYFSQCIYKFT